MAVGIVVAAVGCAQAWGAEPKVAIGAQAQAFVTALNKQDTAAFSALFTGEATISDTLGAYHWAGAGAPAAYLASLRHESDVHGWTDISLAPRGAPFVLTQAGQAYAALPLTAHYKVKGKPAADQGEFILTLTDTGAGWRITSATWALLGK